MNCPICNSKTKYYHNVNGYDSYKCMGCDHIHVSNNDNVEHDELYNIDFYENYMSGIGYHNAYLKHLLPDFNKKISLIKKYLPTGSKVLEVGCGPGYFAEMMQNNGYVVTGVELNEQCKNYAKKHDVEFDNFICEDISNENSSIYGNGYDAVISWATIEHVDDVNKYVLLLRKYTKINGYIFIDTGVTNKFILTVDGGYTSWLFPPYHLHVFSEKSIKLVMQNNGLDIIYFDHWFNNNFKIKILRSLVIVKSLIKQILFTPFKLILKIKPGGIAKIGLIVCKNSNEQIC